MTSSVGEDCMRKGIKFNLIPIEADYAKMNVDTRKLPGKYRASTGQVTGQVGKEIEPLAIKVLKVSSTKSLKSTEIQEIVEIRHGETFQRNYLDYLLKKELIERTIPDKPQSRLQRYRLARKGTKLLDKIRNSY